MSVDVVWLKKDFTKILKIFKKLIKQNSTSFNKMDKLIEKFIPKTIFTSQTAYTSYLPLHIYGKIFGFGIFSVNPKNYTSHFIFQDIIFAVLSITINGLAICFYCKIFSKPNFIQSTVKFYSTLTLTAPFVMFCQYFAYTAFMILSVIKRHEFCMILRKIIKIDLDLEEFRIKFDYHAEMYYIRKVLVMVISIIISMMSLASITEKFYDIHIDFKYDIYLFWILNCGVILLLGFSTVAIGIRNRFDGVNKSIK